MNLALINHIQKGDPMLKKTLQSLFLITLILTFAISLARAQDAPLQGFDQYVEKAMQDWQIPGIAIAIVKDDAVVLAKGYGLRELGKPDKVDEHTLFAIASNTKAFIATAVGILAKEGKLDWDDPAIKYLPELQLYDPYVTRELTIRDLLCHRVGLETYAGDMIWYGSTSTADEVLHQVRYLEPHSSFRSQYGYCNLMFVAAGRIIEEVSGESWGGFLERRIFAPLRMIRSCTSTHELEDMENVATPHTEVGGKIQPIPYRNIDNAAPAGAINSSVMEIAQWLRLQLNYGTCNGKQVIDSTIIDEMRTPHTIIRIGKEQRELYPTRHFITYGLGWFLSDYHGRLVVLHGGGLDGMFSYTGFLPEEKLGIAVLTNRDDHRLMTALFYQIADAYLGVPDSDWSAILLQKRQEEKIREAEKEKKREKERDKKKTPYTSAEKITGNYASKILGDAEISKEGKKLVLTLALYPGVEGYLEHWDYETFLCKWNDPMWGKSYLTFVPDGRGSVESFKVKVREDFIDPLEYVFERTGE